MRAATIADTRRRRRARRGGDQAGAISILAACALFAALAVVALAVDVGRIAHARARLQQQVDAAALAGAYRVGSCSEEPTDPGDIAQLTAARNGFAGSLVTAPSTVRPGVVSLQDGLRRFTEVPDLAAAEAVEVRASAAMPRSLVLPRSLGGEIAVEAHAVGRSTAIAALRLGSSLGDSDSERSGLLNDLFGALLGSAVSLDVLSYQGLLDARVRLSELVAAEASAGTLEELLALELSAGELLTLVASALDTQGSLAAVSVADLAAAATFTGSVPVGDWLTVTSAGEGVALDAVLNVFDLVRTGIVAINGQNVLVVDPLTLSVPGVATTSLRMIVVEAPRIAVGPPGQDEEGAWRTEVRTGQGRIELALEAQATLPVGSATLTLPIFARLAESSARLRSVHCARFDDPISRATVEADAGAAQIGIGVFADLETSDLTVPGTLVEIEVLGIPVARVEGQSIYATSSTSSEVVFEGPFVPYIEAPAEEHTARVGSGDPDAALDAARATFVEDPGLEVTVLGILPLGTSAADIEDDSLAVLEPLLEELPALLELVLETTGLGLAGGDLTLLSLETQRPELVR